MPSENERAAREAAARAAREKAAEDRRRDALAGLLAATVSIKAPEALPARLYFGNRGIGGVDIASCVRFCPSTPYWEDGRIIAHIPAIVAMVEGPKVPITLARTLQRTFITPDGHKAPVASPRRLMPSPRPGATKGAAIRLFLEWDEIEERIGVAEGLETALAFGAATGIPTWSCINAGGLASVILPPSVKEVFIAADHDANGTGLKAARTLARRLRAERPGITVRIVMPPAVGADWADVFAGAA